MFFRSPAKLCVLMHHMHGSSLHLLAAALAIGLGLLAVHAEQVTEQGEKGRLRNAFVHGLYTRCRWLLRPYIACLLH